MLTTCPFACVAPLLAATLLALAAAPVRAEFRPAARPFILWTAADAAAVNKKIASEGWAKKQAAALGDRPVENLFKYQVFGDQAAGKKERDYLLTFIGAPVDEKRRWADNYLHALRYDALYESLTPDQRTGLETTFRAHIQYELDHPYRNTRVSWLPNMQMPRIMGAHLMAVALQDEKLIRATRAMPSGFQDFFDNTLADGGLYNEEFSKMTSLIGEFLLYCRGLDRLGLSDLGSGYVGKGGATVERYVETLIWIGYPRVAVPDAPPMYLRVTMGDAKPGWQTLFNHVIAPGYKAGGKGTSAKDNPDVGWPVWYAANMNGRDHRDTKVDKLNVPQWFELLAAGRPASPFRYFLAQMRGPGQAAYTPTLFWGLDPIDAKEVSPPPAPSRVFPERGFAVLHAEESPAYWESPAPAVALQFATLYVHYTADCFSLLGYVAFNRPVYVNRPLSAGYNGGPWDFSVRGHAGVVVDNEQAQPLGEVPERHDFSPLVKFVSARGALKNPGQTYQAKGEVRSSDQKTDPRGNAPANRVYTGTDLSRSLFLTREYLLDVYELSSDRPRLFDWLVHPLGRLQPQPGQQWEDSTELAGSVFKFPEIKVTGEKRLAVADKAWSVNTVQAYCGGGDVEKSWFGKAWYDRQVGVRISMLPEAGTSVFAFDTPRAYVPGSGSRAVPAGGDEAKALAEPLEIGGVSVVVSRHAPRTVFAALHEPFEHNAPRLTEFRRISQDAEHLAVAVVGKEAGVNDRIFLGFDPAKERTVTDGNDSVTFRDHTFIRITADAVTVTGPASALKLAVAGTPKLVLNGVATPCTLTAGMLSYP